MTKHYPKEFRDEVVEVVRSSGAPLSQVAKEFGISLGALRAWLVKAEKEAGISPKASKEHAELKKRVRLLEQENEVLRRAAVYIGRAACPK